MFGMLADTRWPSPVDFSSLRWCFSASAPLRPETSRRFRERYGVYVRQIYGTTETGTIAVNLDPRVEESIESVGTPLEGVVVDILAEDGRVLPSGATGEIGIRSPAAAREYPGLPDETRAAFVGDYFLPGDIGHKDARSQIYLVGRKSLFINRSGYKVNPREVEAVLERHPKVREAAVVGVTTQYGDQKVKAVLVVSRAVPRARDRRVLSGQDRGLQGAEHRRVQARAALEERGRQDPARVALGRPDRPYAQGLSHLRQPGDRRGRNRRGRCDPQVRLDRHRSQGAALRRERSGIQGIVERGGAVLVHGRAAPGHARVGLGEGDEVITTPMTFCASVNSIIHTGATPVLADVDPITMNIDPAEVAKKITPRTRAIMPVHFAGRPCDMDALMAIAKEHNLMVIEDCAHAIETEYHGKKAGLFGDFGCFSFYVTKNVITGEGGMVIAKDDENAARIKVLALHGMSKDAWKRFSDSGYGALPGDRGGLQVQHDRHPGRDRHPPAAPGVRGRRASASDPWERYDVAFADLPVVRPAPVEAGTVHARHLYAILIATEIIGKSRDQVLNELTALNIGTGVHYTPVHLPHPYYRERFGYDEGAFPNAEYIGDRTLSLPLSTKLTDDDVADVIAAVRRVCQG